MNVKGTPGEKRFNRAAWLAWTLCAIVVLFALWGMAISFGAPDQPTGFLARANTAMNSAFIIVFGLVAALILGRYTRHTIGWLLMSIALSLAIAGFVQIYLEQVTSASTEPGIAVWLNLWLSGWDWWLLIGPLLLILLLFPTGRLLTARWRLVVAAMAFLFAFFLAFVTFSATLTDTVSGKSIPNPIGLIPASLPFELIAAPWAIALFITAAACVVSVFVRYRRAAPVEREQIKWFLYACLVFLVVYSGGLFNQDSNSVFGLLLSAAILLIPVSIGIAILRYRLWDIDLIIRRTVVYVPLTAILAGVFAASITLTQRVFFSLTGSQSDAATVLTTLIVVAAFDPIKTWLQKMVDRRFKEVPDATKRLTALNSRMRSYLQMADAAEMARHTLEEAVISFEAYGGSVHWGRDGSERIAFSTEGWNGRAGISIPLNQNGVPVGRIDLAARKNGTEYIAADRSMLEQTAELLARAFALSDRA